MHFIHLGFLCRKLIVLRSEIRKVEIESCIHALCVSLELFFNISSSDQRT